MKIVITTRYESIVANVSSNSEITTVFEFTETDCRDMTVSEIMDDQIQKHIEYHKAQKHGAQKTCVD